MGGPVSCHEQESCGSARSFLCGAHLICAWVNLPPPPCKQSPHTTPGVIADRQLLPAAFHTHLCAAGTESWAAISQKLDAISAFRSTHKQHTVREQLRASITEERTLRPMLGAAGSCPKNAMPCCMTNHPTAPLCTVTRGVTPYCPPHHPFPCATMDNPTPRNTPLHPTTPHHTHLPHPTCSTPHLHHTTPRGGPSLPVLGRNPGVRVKVGVSVSVGVQSGQNFPLGTSGAHGPLDTFGTHGLLRLVPLATACWPKAP